MHDPQAHPRIFLVRHGQVHNPGRLAYGFLPRMGLAVAGREQAANAGRFLREHGPVAVFHSPLLRAVQTARLIHAEIAGDARVAGADMTTARATETMASAGEQGSEDASGPATHGAGTTANGHVPLHRWHALRESGLARYWQGAPYPELPARYPEVYATWMATPGRVTEGESLAEQAARMAAAIRRMLRRYPTGPLVAVSHRDPILSLRLVAEGRSLDDLHVTYCEPGSITTFVAIDGRLELLDYVEP